MNFVRWYKCLSIKKRKSCGVNEEEWRRKFTRKEVHLQDEMKGAIVFSKWQNVQKKCAFHNNYRDFVI